jgi:hypothetical protein
MMSPVRGAEGGAAEIRRHITRLPLPLLSFGSTVSPIRSLSDRLSSFLNVGRREVAAVAAPYSKQEKNRKEERRTWWQLRWWYTRETSCDVQRLASQEEDNTPPHTLPPLSISADLVLQRNKQKHTHTHTHQQQNEANGHPPHGAVRPNSPALCSTHTSRIHG